MSMLKVVKRYDDAFAVKVQGKNGCRGVIQIDALADDRDLQQRLWDAPRRQHPDIVDAMIGEVYLSGTEVAKIRALL